MARKPKRKSAKPKRKPLRHSGKDSFSDELRIIGGKFRGRKFRYSGDPSTRPMKERVREAIFNLLGPGIKGHHAIDLFAGTGALGLEALSRGAARATFVERHFPSAKLIRQNAAALEVDDLCDVIASDTFFWVQRRAQWNADPITVFISPPYDYYIDRSEDMLSLTATLLQHAPAGSMLIVEADGRFDFNQLPQPEKWDVRRYPPAVVALRECEEPILSEA